VRVLTLNRPSMLSQPRPNVSCAHQQEIACAQRQTSAVRVFVVLDLGERRAVILTARLANSHARTGAVVADVRTLFLSPHVSMSIDSSHFRINTIDLLS
jgi:hypothetical protein